jgi:hypothetical protein
MASGPCRERYAPYGCRLSLPCQEFVISQQKLKTWRSVGVRRGRKNYSQSRFGHAYCDRSPVDIFAVRDRSASSEFAGKLDRHSTSQLFWNGLRRFAEEPGPRMVAARISPHESSKFHHGDAETTEYPEFPRFVILSGATPSRSEWVAESKDPLGLYVGVRRVREFPARVLRVRECQPAPDAARAL